MLNYTELYNKIKELDAFNEMYKTKAVYQAHANKEIEDDMVILSVNVIGFVNHGQKYELLEFAITDIDGTSAVYDFNAVDEFSRYIDKVSYIELMNDSLQIPKDRIKEFFDVTCCEDYNSDYVYDEDIILKDLVILGEKRIINGVEYFGPYTTFFGKFIEKEEYEEQFTSKKSLTKNLMKEVEDCVRNGLLKSTHITAKNYDKLIFDEER